MTLSISCDCGYVAQADGDDELLTDIRGHLRLAHPQEDAKHTDADLLEMAERE